MLGKLPVLGRPTNWITVGQEPTALAVGAGWGSFSLSFGRRDGLIETEILSQRAVKPKTSNQLTQALISYQTVLYFISMFLINLGVVGWCDGAG